LAAGLKILYQVSRSPASFNHACNLAFIAVFASPSVEA